MMEVDTPRLSTSPGVNVNPFLTVPMQFRSDGLGLLLDETDESFSDLRYDEEELENLRKRPRTSSDGIHAPDTLKKVKSKDFPISQIN